MSHSRQTVEEIVGYLEIYDRVVEVAIGRRYDVAKELAERGVTVTATDVHPREIPDGVRFVEDDVFEPDRRIYEGCEALYALNLPPELHRATLEVARQVDAAFLFTTLGGEQPLVPVRRIAISGDTLYLCDHSSNAPDHPAIVPDRQSNSP